MKDDTTNAADDAAESANANGKDQNVYGFCPQCGSPGVNRERRIDGNDRCYHGHIYPSSKAVYRAVVSPARTLPASVVERVRDLTRYILAGDNSGDPVLKRMETHARFIESELEKLNA